MMVKAPRWFLVPSGALAVVTAAAMLTGGCSHSGSGSSPSPKSSSSAPSTAQADGLPPGVSQDDAAPTDVPNKPSARKNVTMTSCTKTAGGWSAGGTATNSANASRTYTITVFFTTTGGTVIAHGDTKATVEPGAQSTWMVKATFAAAETTRCVLRGVA